MHFYYKDIERLEEKDRKIYTRHTLTKINLEQLYELNKADFKTRAISRDKKRTFCKLIK